MNKPQKSGDGSLKAGTSRRSRLGRAGQGGTMPRIMVVALLVVVAGGAALFWPRGGGVPTGIGEHQTTVKAQENLAVPGETPRSGDVDIEEVAATPLTPEKAEGEGKPTGSTQTTTATKPAEPVQQPAARPQTSEPVATKPQTAKPQPTKPKTTEPKVEPTAEGPYAVQVGAFGEAVNADTEAARLKALGWDARVRAGNNSSGEMVFRVWIGYFANRQLAQTFINQNSRHLGGAIPVHR